MKKVEPQLDSQPMGDWLSNEIKEEYVKKADFETLANVGFGEPRATPKFSVEQLKKKGFVGIYFRRRVVP